MIGWETLKGPSPLNLHGKKFPTRKSRICTQTNKKLLISWKEAPKFWKKHENGKKEKKREKVNIEKARRY